jgi:penicillin-binding protein 1C
LASLFLLVTLRLALFGIEWVFNDRVDAITDFPVSSQVFDRNGVLLYEFVGEVRRIPVAPEMIPEVLRQATLVAEDRHFFLHAGFDPIGIARAFWNNWSEDDGLRQGGSTLGQQLVKNTVLGRSTGYRDKVEEILLSVAVDARLSKQDIIHLYLNTIPYGSNVYGVEAASRFYFSKSVQDLSVAESATLASLPKHPTYLSPFGEHVDQLMVRRDYILAQMHERGFIDDAAYANALTETLRLAKPQMPIKAPHFVMEVRNQLEEALGKEVLETEGLQIRTTLDWTWQETAERLTQEQGKALDANRANSAGLLAMDPRSGEIIAMVGNRSYFEGSAGNFNMTTALRQPGSAFKPLVYAALLDQKIVTPATILMDVPTNFGTLKDPYIPQDYDGRFRGPVTMRSALAQSLNIPAVQALTMVGLENVIDTAEDLGLSTLGERERFGPSIVLGGAEVKLVELVSAYSVFANHGASVMPQTILEITAEDGRVYEWHTPLSRQVLRPETSYQISSILSDNDARAPIFGTRGPLSFADRPVAAKTGTTQAYRDAWTVGYTPSIAVGVWVGNDNNQPLRSGAAGAMAAAPLWRSFMDAYLKDTPVETFEVPRFVELVNVPTILGVKREYVAPWQIDAIYRPIVRYRGDQSRINVVRQTP